jgi:hypothetical protein
MKGCHFGASSSAPFVVSFSAQVSTLSGFSSGGGPASILRGGGKTGSSFFLLTKSMRRNGIEAEMMPLLVSTWPQRRRSVP